MLLAHTKQERRTGVGGGRGRCKGRGRSRGSDRRSGQNQESGARGTEKGQHGPACGPGEVPLSLPRLICLPLLCCLSVARSCPFARSACASDCSCLTVRFGIVASGRGRGELRQRHGTGSLVKLAAVSGIVALRCGHRAAARRRHLAALVRELRRVGREGGGCRTMTATVGQNQHTQMNEEQ